MQRLEFLFHFTYLEANVTIVPSGLLLLSFFDSFETLKRIWKRQKENDLVKLIRKYKSVELYYWQMKP